MKQFSIEEELKTYDSLLYNMVKTHKDKTSATLYNKKREEIINKFNQLEEEKSNLQETVNRMKDDY